MMLSKRPKRFAVTAIDTDRTRAPVDRPRIARIGRSNPALLSSPPLQLTDLSLLIVPKRVARWAPYHDQRSAISDLWSGNVAAPLCGRRETIIYIKARDAAIAEESPRNSSGRRKTKGEVGKRMLCCNSKFSKLAKGYKVRVARSRSYRGVFFLLNFISNNFERFFFGFLSFASSLK